LQVYKIIVLFFSKFCVLISVSSGPICSEEQDEHHTLENTPERSRLTL
jgi:hypothetical protein